MKPFGISLVSTFTHEIQFVNINEVCYQLERRNRRISRIKVKILHLLAADISYLHIESLGFGFSLAFLYQNGVVFVAA